MAPTRGQPPATRRPDEPTEVVFDLRDLSVYYGETLARARRQHADLQERDHGDDRTVGLRQEHVRAQPQPDERLDRRVPRHGRGALPRRTTSTAAASTRSRCAGGSGWSSSAPTRSRSRSSTTSPGRRGSSGSSRSRRARREGAARRGPVGRGQGPPQAERARPLRRPAAAAVHRPRDRDRARRAAARRARVGARPDLDRLDRGADARRSSATTRS